MYHYPSPITDRKIRFALVGCGRIAQNHFAAIKQHSDKAELISVCDIDSNALAEAAKTTGAKPYSTLTQMLSNSDADVFILTTPSGLHSDQAIEIASAGRSVITEKPMATKWEEAKNMVKACDDSGVRLFVVKQNRRNATLQLLKQAIEKKRFGKIYMVNLNVFWTRPQSYYDQGGWRGRWEFDGGAFMNQASHYVDLISWLIGPLESLQAYTATLARDIEAEDSGVISLKWRNGALGSMNVTMLTYPKNLEGSITILGEKGTVKIGGVAVNEVQHWEFEDKNSDDIKIKEASYETTSVYGFGHPLYYENVINVMRGEAEPETDGREGLKSLEVIIAAYLSARDGRRIALPLDY
jgi:UDP-N-acetyl-2-amino-2-deoxyglucuronate dehydrogenase